MLVRSLSKGLRQRLGLAQTVVHNPPLIILDEPTIGIDPQQVIEVREFIHSLKASHTVLVSSHILSEIEQICDRVIIMNQGCIVDSLQMSDLDKSLEDVFLSLMEAK
jgi:ABC-2 type transport system ATP-binding protein